MISNGEAASYSMIPFKDVPNAKVEGQGIIYMGRPKGLSLTGVGVKRKNGWQVILRGNEPETDWIETPCFVWKNKLCYQYKDTWYYV